METNRNIHSLNDLPLFLQASDIALLFGISKPQAYVLLNRKDFPTVLVGEKRRVVPRDSLISWIQKQSERALVGLEK